MDSGFYDTFKIKTYMMINKLSQSEFCEKCGISTYVLGKIFKQDHNLNIDALFKIADEMKLHISELFI